MMRSRTDIINNLILSHEFKSYLEIGLGDGRNFNEISCAQKYGVDPIIPYLSQQENTLLYNMSSDNFFLYNRLQFDLIFIDGLHYAEQVEKDIVNGWRSLNMNGMLLIHDCFPHDKDMQNVPRTQLEWTGDVWRTCVGFKSKYGMKVKTFLLNEIYGLFVIMKSDLEIRQGFIDREITYEEFSNYIHLYLGNFENI